MASENAHEERPLAVARRAQIAELLRRTGSITVAELEQRFSVSAMTARRDLEQLERSGRARRTHGGAVLPEITAHKDSFVLRLARETEAKAALADAAHARLTAGESVFLDSSSTCYVLARRIAQSGVPLTVITNSLPVMELLAGAATGAVTLVGIGGTLRPVTRSFVGPLAIQSIGVHFADRLFLSVKGLTPDGVLTDADALEAEVKRTMIAHAESSVLLLDRTKLASRGLSAIDTIGRLSGAIVHGLDKADVVRLRTHGIDVVAAS